MTLATVSEVEVRAELWLSFISVLRAYAVIAGFDEAPATTRNLDDSPDSVIWSAPSREGDRRCGLTVSYDAKSGEGKWRLSADQEPFNLKKTGFDALRTSFRSFTLESDGTVSLDGSTIDMDHAAIQWMGWFASTIKTGNMEVPA